LACEAGWDKDFIADHFTVEQILKYCELIQRRKLNEIELNAIVNVHVIAVAIGSIKYQDFKEFMDKLTMKEKSLDEQIEEAIKAGFPIEVH